MVNSAGEEFFNQQQDDPLAYGPYTVQLKALAKQVHAGKARYEGGYYAGFDNCDAREVEAYTSYGKSFRQLGLSFPEDLVETAVTAHYRQGGIDVDTATMRSSVPGLYVAGGLGGHSNGLIALATYDGKRVADGVAARPPRLEPGTLPEAECEREAQRLDALLVTAPRWRAGFAGQEHHSHDDVGEGRRREGRGEPQVGLAGHRGLPARPAAAHEHDPDRANRQL